MADQFQHEEPSILQIEGYRRVAQPIISTSTYYDYLFEFRGSLEKSETKCRDGQSHKIIDFRNSPEIDLTNEF